MQSDPHRHRIPVTLLLLLAVLVSAQSAAAAPAPSAVQQALVEQVGQLRASGGLYLQGLAIATGGLLPDFYAARDYTPVWTLRRRVDELLDLLATAERHGLDPRDYNLPQLIELRTRVRASDDARLRAAYDIALTESLIRFGYHQRFGKVNPARMEPTWNFSRQFRPGEEPLTALTAAVAAPTLEGFLGEWLDRAPLYRLLQDTLAAYRVIGAQGGWESLPEGPTLRPGDEDARVPLLRRQLAIMGDLPSLPPGAEPDNGLVYDEELTAAVGRFQARHGLAADGVLGAKSLAAMNVPVEARIDQLRLSLERARWVVEESAGEVIVVNIAGYQVYAARDGRPFWWRRAVVGTSYRKTPVFRGSMTYLDLNPTWTVPPTILREDVLPRVRRDPSYLARENISVLDRQGRVVDPATIDWAAVGGRPPYTFRQGPGPKNALGRIKFMFPNPHAVFLHDTPAKGLFASAERSFSSGCIRVEDPLSLAEIVLADPARWNRQSLEAAIAKGATQTVRLPKPWPVLILYWTADLDPDGNVRFLPDVYGRDAELLRALNGDVVIEFPPDPPEALPAA